MRDNLDTLCISHNKTITDALKRLNNIRNLSRLILFVLNDQRQVIGSLTDGDIRRSLAKDEDIYKPVGEICNYNFIYEYVGDEFTNLIKYRKEKIVILPILNENKELQDIIDLDKTKAVLPVECMIMAGGRGKRLSPLTDKIPKPMLILGNKPIIEHNIDRLISYGIKKIYISLNYLGEQIAEYFGDGSKKSISIEYIWEDKFLGTAGALSLVDKFESEYILLMNSDLFTNIDFEDLYCNMKIENASMAVASTQYKVDIPYAVFETTDNQVLNFKEKPSYVYHSNAGIYLIKKELINRIPHNQFYDITDFMDGIVRDGYKLIHNPIMGYWIDIGSPQDYKQAQEFIKHIN